MLTSAASAAAAYARTSTVASLVGVLSGTANSSIFNVIAQNDANKATVAANSRAETVAVTDYKDILQALQAIAAAADGVTVAEIQAYAVSVLNSVVGA